MNNSFAKFLVLFIGAIAVWNTIDQLQKHRAPKAPASGKHDLNGIYEDNAPFADPTDRGTSNYRFYNSFTFPENTWGHQAFATDDGYEIWYYKDDPQDGLKRAVRRIGANGEPFADETTWVFDAQNYEVVPGARGALLIEHPVKNEPAKTVGLLLERNLTDGGKEILVDATEVSAIWSSDRFNLLVVNANDRDCNGPGDRVAVAELTDDGSRIKEIYATCLDHAQFNPARYKHGVDGIETRPQLTKLAGTADSLAFAYQLVDKTDKKTRIDLVIVRAGKAETFLVAALPLGMFNHATIESPRVESDGRDYLVEWLSENSGPNAAPFISRYALVNGTSGQIRCVGERSGNWKIFQNGTLVGFERQPGSDTEKIVVMSGLCGEEKTATVPLWRRGEHEPVAIGGAGKFLFLTEGWNQPPGSKPPKQPHEPFRFTAIRFEP